MNTVKDNTDKELSTKMTVEELLACSDHGSKETAFIGQVGNGPQEALYLITWEGICLADNPSKAWLHSARVYIDQFVDVTIIATSKDS